MLGVGTRANMAAFNSEVSMPKQKDADAPGRRERHLQRRRDNPLFGNPPPCVSAQAVEDARRTDRAESQAFHERFLALVQEAAELKPTAESADILRLKEGLDQAYEQACGLGGDQSQPKRAIRRLTELIMQAVERGAGNDPTARAELAQEASARAMHYRLLEHDLVADLLAPDSPIAPDELLPTLLSSDPSAFAAALELFDQGQLQALLADAEALLDARGGDLPEADRIAARIADMARHLNAGAGPAH
jgi:hypothetical protein